MTYDTMLNHFKDYLYNWIRKMQREQFRGQVREPTQGYAEAGPTRDINVTMGLYRGREEERE